MKIYMGIIIRLLANKIVNVNRELNHLDEMSDEFEILYFKRIALKKLLRDAKNI